MTESNYIIRQIYRHSSFYKLRESQFITLDKNNQVIERFNLGTMNSETIVCDGCNSLINSENVITMFYLNEENRECISRAECQSCYEQYFEEIEIIPNVLFNVCSRILHKKQWEYFNGVKIDLQSANLYCQIWKSVNHDARNKLEVWKGTYSLFIKLWQMTGVKSP